MIVNPGATGQRRTEVKQSGPRHWKEGLVHPSDTHEGEQKPVRQLYVMQWVYEKGNRR